MKQQHKNCHDFFILMHLIGDFFLLWKKNWLNDKIRVLFSIRFFLWCNLNCDYIWKVAVALFKYMIFVPPDSYWQTTWRSVGSAHSFVSASLGCGMPCGENSRKMSRYVASPDGENKGKIVMKMMPLEQSKHLLYKSNEYKQWGETESREVVCKKKPRAWMEGQKTGWGTMKLSSFNFPKLWAFTFSRCHGNRWIHRHNKKQLNSFVSHESFQAWLIKKRGEWTFLAFPVCVMCEYEKEKERSLSTNLIVDRYGLLVTLYFK